MTQFQIRALTILRDGGPKLPEQLYPLLFPKGRFNTDRDCGSTKGGPSRTECAVNWHLGKLGKLVNRTAFLSKDRRLAGMWEITGAGLTALRKAGH